MKLLLLGSCVLLAAGIKGIPRRDITQHLPGAEVYAAEAYDEGCAIHDQAGALNAKAEATIAASTRERLAARAQKRYSDALMRFDAALDFATRSEEPLPFLADLHARYADAKLALGDPAGAHAALEQALAIRPGELRAIYSLARVQLLQNDHTGLRATWQRLEQEAEIHAAAWDYLDRLIVELRAAAAAENADPGFAAWVDEQTEIVAESVRWSTLEE